ncbi:NUDIX hydrolase [Pantoea sp. B65]|uniref:NUDIX hydrolase n=1 Tax=Pantoea sp. B65 TaxID=2813359 RepID=UPI0039B36C15
MKAQLILIAGPYRGGTGGDPQLMAKNLLRLEEVALQVYQRGHLPLIGEWLALPLASVAGSQRLGDKISEEFMYPLAHRLIQRCDAILRIAGESDGADNDVRVAQQQGIKVYYQLEEIANINSLSPG